MWGGMRGKPGSRTSGLPSSSFFGGDPFWPSPFEGDPFGSAFGAGSCARADRHAHGQKAAKDRAIEMKLPCSLEELYKGTTKKMKISREIVDAGGRTMQVEEIIRIDVKPGWKKGTKITFAEKGNETPNVIPADLIFIIDEKTHPVFTRDGNDLVMTQKIQLAEALTGYTVHPTTLDGRSFTVPISSVIHPRYEQVVPGEGMPFPKDPSRKGSLRIKFDIEFPTILTSNQKSGVTRLLGLQRNMNKDDHRANMAGNSHMPCQVTQAATQTMAATHGENSRPGRVIYVGSFPVSIDSS